MTNLPSAKREPPSVLIGVCGGIAAYKAVELVSRLRQKGCRVQVTMSAAACGFVTPLTFGAVAGTPVLTQAIPDAKKASGEALYPHLYPATQVDAFVLIPATANMIGRIGQGLGDEIVSTCALSLPPHCIRFFCPAMNVEMWEQEVVQENVRRMEARGWRRLGPETGTLACGMEGPGRMAEPAVVLEQVLAALQHKDQLHGQQVLILSGPTHEHLDPVRYIGNASSGRMGQALAEEAACRGAHVTLITGPVHDSFLPRHARIDIVRVVSADEMLEAAERSFAVADHVVFAAAVADYKPAQSTREKTGKRDAPWPLTLLPTPDIAATLAAKRTHQRLIGFALQTGDGVKEAQEKLTRKGLDVIILNHPEALNASSGTYTCLQPGSEPVRWGTLDKRSCARSIWDLRPGHSRTKIVG